VTVSVTVSTHSRVAEDSLSGVLERIAEPYVDLVLWHRTLPAAIIDWLDASAPDRLPHGRILVAAAELEAGIATLVPARNGMMQWLAADIADLARRFAAIARTELVDIRLDVIRRDACWRFHRDMVALRLLTTYRGPGTQIPPLDAASRALAEQRAYRGPLDELRRGTVALFRGDPHDEGTGLLHRSPPVAGTDITRLLLCLNAPSLASPRQWRP